MKILKKKSSKVENIIFTSFVLIMILFFPTVYYCIDEIVIFKIASILFLIYLFYAVIILKFKISFKLIIFTLIYIIIATFYWILKGRETLNSFYYLMYIFPVMIIFTNSLLIHDKYIKVFSIFVRLITIIAIISLFFWFFGSTLKIIDSTNTLYINWGGYRQIKSFYNIYFELQGHSMSLFGIHFGVKNCAIFTEAPMASFMFSLALIFNINYTKIKSNFINPILVIAILSTFSTTGFIVLILCIMQYFKSKKYKSKYIKLLKAFFIVIFLIISIILFVYLISSKSNTGSWIVRSSMISKEINAFLNSPFLGNGFGKYTYGSSNSFFATLADGGLIVWGIYYIPLIYGLLFRKRNFKWFILIYSFMFAITVVQYNLIAIFISALLWNNLIFNSKEKSQNDIYSNSNL